MCNFAGIQTVLLKFVMHLRTTSAPQQEKLAGNTITYGEHGDCFYYNSE